jgi:fumarate reductase subunit C
MKGTSDDRYQTPMPSTWFFQRPGYRRFMAREATAIALAGYLVYLLVWLHKLGQGYEAYDAMMATSRHPSIVIIHALLFGGLVYHSITWFNLTPKIMPMYVAEEKVPDFWAAIFMGYMPWLVVSAVLLWGVLW